MKFLSALLGLLIFVASLIFALSNRQSVTVNLWPFDLEMTAPLYIMTLGALAVGLLIGSFYIWLTALPHRFTARRLGKDVTLLSGKIVELERELEPHRARSKEAHLLLPPPRWKFWKKEAKSGL